MPTVATPAGQTSASSYALAPDPNSTPATVIAWPSRRHWLAHVDAWANHQDAAETCRRHHTSIRTVLAVARADAASADSTSGRNVTTSNRTVAARTGLTERVVRRARAVLIDIGLAVVIARGRYLSHAERADARNTHGGYQTRAASTRSLTVPHPNRRPTWAIRVRLPRRGSVQSTSPSRRSTNARGRARVRKAPPKPHPKPSLAAKRLAGQLTRRLPHLCPPEQHINTFAIALDRAGLSGWGQHELLQAMDEHNIARGLFSLPVASQRHPLRLFMHLARAATDGRTPPSVLRAADAKRRAAEQAASRAAHAEQVARSVPASSCAALTEMRAMLRAKRLSGAWRTR